MFDFLKKKKTEQEELDRSIAEDATDLANMNIRNEDKSLARTVEFLSWIQEFSKKVVAATFVIYIISMIFSLIMIGVEFSITYEALYIDTFISEINTTFRDVIGGYLLKAATENVIKIGGGYMESYMSSKTTIIEKKVAVAAAAASEPSGDEGDGGVDFTAEDPMNPATRAMRG